MSIRRAMLRAVATTSIVVAGGAWAPPPTVAAATPECGERCISVFSYAFGTYTDLNYVETVLGGAAEVGQPVILSPASSSDPAQDLLPRVRLVSEFYDAGMVSAQVNRRYGGLRAAQIEFAPAGVPTGLCVGLARAAFQNQGLTLQPCTVPGTTVWIVDTPDSPATAAAGFFPLVNASTRGFTRPYGMDFPQNADPADVASAQIRVRRLQFDHRDHTLPRRQLWGIYRGVVMENQAARP